jgi:hypothetical protein
MKENRLNEQLSTSSTNPLQKRISLLSEKGFLWREIAELTRLPKKLIKGIAKGEYAASEEESNRMCKILDETIERLQTNINTDAADIVRESGIDIDNSGWIQLQIKGISIYKGTEDDTMIIKVHTQKPPSKRLESQ